MIDIDILWNGQALILDIMKKKNERSKAKQKSLTHNSSE